MSLPHLRIHSDEGMILGQTGDKYLKLLAFFRTIMSRAPEEWVEAHLIAFQYDSPDLTLCVLGEDMFVCRALTSFLHFPLSVEAGAKFTGMNFRA
jgi:hypothetical protein